MSEINEKIISEFLELMKKVGALEMQVQGLAKDHAMVLSKCTNMIQTMQGSMVERLKDQNDLVQKSNDSIAEQVNRALSRVSDVAIETTRKYIETKVSDNKFVKFEEKVNDLSNEVKQPLVEKSVLDKRLCDMNFTFRVVNWLRGERIITIGDLIKLNNKQLLKIRNIGVNSVKEIVAELDKLGLKLRK